MRRRPVRGAPPVLSPYERRGHAWRLQRIARFDPVTAIDWRLRGRRRGTSTIRLAISPEVAQALAGLRRPLPLLNAGILGVSFAVLGMVHLGAGWRWMSLLPLLAALAIIVVLDLRSRVIPDVLTLPGVIYALLIAAALRDRPSLAEAALGAVAGGGVVLLLAIVSRGAVGGGDIKLMAMLGAALGAWPALVALALAHVAGGVIAVALLVARRAGRKSPLPIGALIALFGALLLAQGGELFSLSGASG